MNNSINLLDHKKSLQPKRENNRQRPLRLVAMGLMIAVSASSVIFFLLVTLSPLPQLRKQEKIASFTLTQSNTNIIKLAWVKERTNNIQEIIDKRPYYDKILGSIQTKLPSGVGIDSVDIEKNNFSITLSSNSLKQLDDFLNTLSNNESGKLFSQTKIVNLSTGGTKGAFLLTINLKNI